MPRIRTLVAASCAFAAAPCIPLAQAQEWPTRPIRLVVPFAPGGNTDIIARAISPRMTQALGQQLLIDNRGGAGSTIGTAIVAKAPADGYTLLMVSSAHVINPAVRKNLPYDAARDFAPVTLVADVPNVLVVHPSLPAKDVGQVVALARSRPGELLYATPGRGSSSHLAVAMLASLAKVEFTQVPYKGVGPATVDLLSGQVHMMFASMPATIQHVRGKRLRMVGQAGATRSPAAPDTPTMVEQGLADFIVLSGFGMLAPAGTPKGVVERVNAAVRHALADPDVARNLSGQGAQPVGNSPLEYERHNRREIDRWGAMARQAGVEPE